VLWQQKQGGRGEFHRQCQPWGATVHLGCHPPEEENVDANKEQVKKQIKMFEKYILKCDCVCSPSIPISTTEIFSSLHE